MVRLLEFTKFAGVASIDYVSLGCLVAKNAFISMVSAKRNPFQPFGLLPIILL